MRLAIVQRKRKEKREIPKTTNICKFDVEKIIVFTFVEDQGVMIKVKNLF